MARLVIGGRRWLLSRSAVVLGLVGVALSPVVVLSARGDATAGETSAFTQRLATPLIRISWDPYSSKSACWTSTAQNRTEVEPSSASHGSTIVAAFQAGRFKDGGSMNIGWATSTDGGKTWTHGFLPDTTTCARPKGSWARITDPSVAYDGAQHEWLIVALAMNGPDTSSAMATPVVARSANGTSWSAPVALSGRAATDDNDKPWITCDNGTTSPYDGHCYVVYDDDSLRRRLFTSVSTDGGVSWSLPTPTTSDAEGVSAQPVVTPRGVLVVPFTEFGNTANSISVYTSRTGGAPYSAPSVIARWRYERPASPIRPRSPFPSASVDPVGGRVFVVWSECSLEPSCSTNDVVITSSSDQGRTWAPVARLPTGSDGTADYFLPTISVDPASSGESTGLAVSYYFYPHHRCSPTTVPCTLEAGEVISRDAGSRWSVPETLTPQPMALSWLPITEEDGSGYGAMVGDYGAILWSGEDTVAIVIDASAPSADGTLHEAAFAAITRPGPLSARSVRRAHRPGPRP